MDRVVYPGRDSLRDYVDTDLLPMATRARLFGNTDDYVSRYVEHPKLRQLLEYTLVFLGGAPHNTPALYSIMSHVDLNLNVFYPGGGIAGVVDAVADVAREQGADIETGVTVRGIRGRRGAFELDTDAGTEHADIVVSNANPAHTERALLPADAPGADPDAWDDRTYAPSAFMLYLGVGGDVDPLSHHSLVLPTDWDPHFERIFDDPAWPQDPAYYLSVASKTDETVAPDGHHAVVVLVPIAPGSTTTRRPARPTGSFSVGTSPSRPGSTSGTASSSRSRPAFASSPTGTATRRGRHWGSHTRSSRRGRSGRTAGAARTASTTPAPTPRPASGCRCVSSAASARHGRYSRTRRSGRTSAGRPRGRTDTAGCSYAKPRSRCSTAAVL
jgi:hypothetical protein